MNPSIEYGESLDYVHWKFKYNTSDRSFHDLVKRLNASGVQIKSQDQVRRYLNRLLGIKMQRVDCCFNNCMVFVGPDLLRRRCSLCKEFRYLGGEDEDAQGEFYNDISETSKLEAKAYFSYLPLIPRLRLLFANKDYAHTLRYPTTLENNPAPETLHDIWDAEMMKRWKREGTNTHCYSD